MTSNSNIVSTATNNYITALQDNLDTQNDYLNSINDKNNILSQKHEIQLNQLKEIQDKEDLLLTRSRMLQIAQDRNTYKKKIIYTLLAIIFGLFILILFIYVLFTRKMSAAMPNRR